MACSVTSGQFAGDAAAYYVLGTAFVLPEEREPSRVRTRWLTTSAIFVVTWACAWPGRDALDCCASCTPARCPASSQQRRRGTSQHDAAHAVHHAFPVGAVAAS